jgi:Family of unknown function (DUF7019)
MRQLIYRSDRKLIEEFSDTRSDSWWVRGGSIGLDASSLSVHLTVNSPSTTDDAQRHRMAVRLEKAIKEIRRAGTVTDYRSPGLRRNQWISFDQEMAYGTFHEDRNRLPDDIALFASADRRTTPESEVLLLLCGSVVHLCRKVQSAGRMGSGSDWLRQLILHTEGHRNDDGTLPAHHAGDPLWQKRYRDALEDTAFDVHDHCNYYGLDPRARLRGLAQVLMDIDRDEWPRRLVVATPLYVENANLDARRRTSERFNLRRTRTT